MVDPDFSELEQDFPEVTAILREGRLQPPTEAPGEHVWAAIQNELSGGPVEHYDEYDPSYDAEPANVVSMESRRSRGKMVAFATGVAAAVLLVAVPLAIGLRGGGPDQTADLVALGEFAGSGNAELDGRQLEVDLEGLTAAEDSFYELWLLDLEGDELQDLISLGPVAADGTFEVPEDLDLTEFSVVDVSVEPNDGDPQHSGNSVLRGDLADS